MLFSLQRLPLSAFLLLRLLDLMATAFLPQGLFGSSNDYRQIVLQPHGTNGRKSYHPIEVFSTPSILPFSLTSSNLPYPPSLNGTLFLDICIKTFNFFLFATIFPWHHYTHLNRFNLNLFSQYSLYILVFSVCCEFNADFND